MKKTLNIFTRPNFQRYFYLYFFIGIFIVFLIISAVQYASIILFIDQYENDKILDSLKNIKQKVTEAEDQQRQRLLLLKNAFTTYQTEEIDKNKVNTLLAPQSMFFVFNAEYNLVLGDDWPDFLAFIKGRPDLPSVFLYGDDFNVYQVAQDITADYIYYYIIKYTQPALPQIFFHTFTMETFKNNTDRYIKTVYRSFLQRSEGQDRPQPQKEYELQTLDNVFSYGIYTQYDSQGSPKIIHIFPFHREMYSFMSKFYLLVAFIALFALFGICWLLYQYISKKIFDPLQFMIQQMKDISVHPEHIVPIAPQNEIFQFFEYFNNMLASIEHYRLEKIKHEHIQTKLELELVRINRLSELGRRIQGVVHNLNSPLNSVIGYAQLLAKEWELSYADLQLKNNPTEDLQKIITNARIMSETIKQLLYKTRDDSFAMPITVDINTLIRQELSFCQHNLFFKHNVKLVLQLAEGLPELTINYGDISQVFQSIFNNAMEAMSNVNPKVLTVITASSSDFVVFSLTDTGIGIPPDVVDHIFETGFSTKTQTEESGFGIGLALSKMIIDKCHGWIKVTSEPGGGTTVSVGIPGKNGN